MKGTVILRFSSSCALSKISSSAINLFISRLQWRTKNKAALSGSVKPRLLALKINASMHSCSLRGFKFIQMPELKRVLRSCLSNGIRSKEGVEEMTSVPSLESYQRVKSEKRAGYGIGVVDQSNFRLRNIYELGRKSPCQLQIHTESTVKLMRYGR